MKKIAFLSMLVVFLSVEAICLDKTVPITEGNIAFLNGKWEGDRSVIPIHSGSKTEWRKTEMEINNDTLPLEGVIILHFKLGEPERLEFKNGVLKNGKIFIQMREDVRQWWEFDLYSKGEKMELRGEYQIVKSGGYDILTGKFILRKK